MKLPLLTAATIIVWTTAAMAVIVFADAIS